MEVAGVILAVLPLVVESFDAYSRAAETLFTFRQYHKVLIKLKASVIMHRALFVNSSEDLKSAIRYYKNTVKKGQQSHSGSETEQRVCMSLHACSASLNPITDSLNDVLRKLKSLERHGIPSVSWNPVSLTVGSGLLC